METLPWLLLVLPLLAFGGITACGWRRQRPAVVARLAVGSALGTLLVAWWAWRQGLESSGQVIWLQAGGFRISFGWVLDGLSRPMAVVVAGVTALVQIYSLGYMRDDRAWGRYFAGLCLFTVAMMGIVLAPNLLQTYFCWELVGLASYLLIGHWHERIPAADAAKKAFLTNRIGDLGLLAGVLLVWHSLGTLDLARIREILAADPEALGSTASVAGLLIFLGAAGKSAQFPLQVWLPDAMEGPTPVSALIHAATMVAAGVYLLCRWFMLLAVPGSIALEVVVWVGLFTALMAALVACRQDDFKRVLAWSTISQLGYMMLAVGLAGGGGLPVAAMYHLSTHAAFKALLFLGAGAVIHALHHQEQNIWKLGGLARRMPVTFACFGLAALALCGVPPLSGAYSKDAILALAHEQHRAGIGLLALLGSALTAFYMVRLATVVFLGPAKSQAVDCAVEVPAVMRWPMVLLAVPTVLGGLWGIDEVYARAFGVAMEGGGSVWARLLSPWRHAPGVALTALAATLAGGGLAWLWYRCALSDPLEESLGTFGTWCREAFRLDVLYERTLVRTHDWAGSICAAADRWVLSGFLIQGLQGLVASAGRLVRRVQTGNVQMHAVFFVVGVVLWLWVMLGWE